MQQIICILLQNDLELKEKKICASRYGFEYRQEPHVNFSSKRPMLLINFNVAFIIVLFVTSVNSE